MFDSKKPDEGILGKSKNFHDLAKQARLQKEAEAAQRAARKAQEAAQKAADKAQREIEKARVQREKVERKTAMVQEKKQTASDVNYELEQWRKNSSPIVLDTPKKKSGFFSFFRCCTKEDNMDMQANQPLLSERRSAKSR